MRPTQGPKGMGPRGEVITLGCRVNQWDGAWIAQMLRGVPEPVVVLNTCAVTHKAVRDARKMLSRIRRKNPGARVVVTGCAATVETWEGVEVVPKEDLPRFFGVRRPTLVDPLGHRTRPVVKVQDGCDFRCTFCIVPHVRGKSRSRPMDVVLQEVRRLVERGVREVVVAGVELGSWGKEWRYRLYHLAQALAALPGNFRVRFSSLLPIHLEERLVDLMADRPDRFAPHLHLPLQSASERVLRAMRRPYHLRTYVRKLEYALDRLWPVGIGVDVIAGFPTERDEDFMATYRFLEDYPFAYFHVFEFSPREGTPAASLPPLPPAVRRARVQALLALDRRKRRAFLEHLVGRAVDVVVEREEGEMGWGTSGEFARVRIPARIPVGSRVALRGKAVDETSLCLVAETHRGVPAS